MLWVWAAFAAFVRIRAKSFGGDFYYFAKSFKPLSVTNL